MMETQHAAGHDGPALQLGRLGNSHSGDGTTVNWDCGAMVLREEISEGVTEMPQSVKGLH